jgi:prepilin-type N-terminal cleavage/methylation domain-containing protein
VIEQKTQRGFTLVELMVSLVIFSFAIAGVLAVAVSMTRSYREQRRAVAIENAARAPLDFVVDAVRQASPGVITGTIKDANTCAVGALTLVDKTNAPDELEVVYASGGVVSTTHSAFTSSSTTITLPATHGANFAAGDYVLVSDISNGTMVKVTAVNNDTLTVAPTCAGAFPTGGYAAGAILVRAQRARFSVAPDPDNGGQTTLWMDPDGIDGPLTAEPVAEGVEDFQVAIGVDTNSDKALTDNGSSADEWQGNATGDVALTGDIRAVKIAIVARDTTALMGVPSFYEAADVLNHTGSTTADNYRRRMLESTVEIRNLTGSP